MPNLATRSKKRIAVSVLSRPPDTASLLQLGQWQHEGKEAEGILPSCGWNARVPIATRAGVGSILQTHGNYHLLQLKSFARLCCKSSSQQTHAKVSFSPAAAIVCTLPSCPFISLFLATVERRDPANEASSLHAWTRQAETSGRLTQCKCLLPASSPCCETMLHCAAYPRAHIFS